MDNETSLQRWRIAARISGLITIVFYLTEMIISLVWGGEQLHKIFISSGWISHIFQGLDFFAIPATVIIGLITAKKLGRSFLIPLTPFLFFLIIPPLLKNMPYVPHILFGVPVIIMSFLPAIQKEADRSISSLNQALIGSLGSCLFLAMAIAVVSISDRPYPGIVMLNVVIVCVSIIFWVSGMTGIHELYKHDPALMKQPKAILSCVLASVMPVAILIGFIRNLSHQLY